MLFDRLSRFESSPLPILLADIPPRMHECFALLRKAGADYFALYGGAVRDADYAGRHKKPMKIKDYDIRVWLPAENYQKNLDAFVSKLAQAAGTVVCEETAPGTDRIRYCFNFKDTEIDISVRPVPALYKNRDIPVEAVAVDRANDSDVALSSVAIDANDCGWARPEYVNDRCDKTLTVYPGTNKNRIVAYARRMKEKFPEHAFVFLDPSMQSLINDEKQELSAAVHLLK